MFVFTTFQCSEIYFRSNRITPPTQDFCPRFTLFIYKSFVNCILCVYTLVFFEESFRGETESSFNKLELNLSEKSQNIIHRRSHSFNQIVAPIINLFKLCCYGLIRIFALISFLDSSLLFFLVHERVDIQKFNVR